MAPEIVLGTDDSYTAKVDVFSLGRSVWQMVYRCEPIDEKVKNTIAHFPEPLPHLKLQPVIIDDDVWKSVKW